MTYDMASYINAKITANTVIKALRERGYIYGNGVSAEAEDLELTKTLNLLIRCVFCVM